MNSRGRSRWWGRAALAVALVSALCAGGAWFLSRESTLIAAAEYLERRLDGRLAVADVKGSLLGSIHVRELRYEDEFGRLALDEARMEWRPLRLLIGQVAVGAMSANAVRLELAKTEDERREPPQSLSAPISFAVTDFTIGTLSIVQPDATHAISDIRAAFAGDRKQLKAQVKSLATQWGHVKGELKIGASQPFALDGDIEIASLEAGRYSLTTRLGGSLLQAEARLEAKEGATSIVVLETKGLHLRNEDTAYKQALLERLTEIYQQGGGLRVGELAFEGGVQQRVVCDLVFDDAWRGALSARHFS